MTVTGVWSFCVPNVPIIKNLTRGLGLPLVKELESVTLRPFMLLLVVDPGAAAAGDGAMAPL
jgi:hypothetical protein